MASREARREAIRKASDLVRNSNNPFVRRAAVDTDFLGGYTYTCPCPACMGTLSPPEPDEDELERWIVWNDIRSVIAVIEAQ